MGKHRTWNVIFGSTFIAAVASAQPPHDRGGAHNTSEMSLGALPGLPTCLQGAPQSGDPRTSAFILFAKGKPGCAVPWHWHGANERLMIVSGAARVAMRDAGAPVVLRPGGFADLPATHIHEFRCIGTCSFFIDSDGKFDIHYVDPDGHEISPDQAMKPMNETVAEQ